MKMKLFLGAVVLLLAGYAFWIWDGEPPRIEWTSTGDTVGPRSEVSLAISDSGKGLHRIRIAFVQGGARHSVYEEEMSRSWKPWSDGTGQRSIALSMSELKAKAPLNEGGFSIEIGVSDHANWWLFARSVDVTRSLKFDATAPRIALRSTQHSIHQGGAELAVYTVSSDTADSGVRVGTRQFQGVRMPDLGKDVWVCLFALPYHDTAAAGFQVWADDKVGNQSLERLPVHVNRRRFRKRRFNISQRFIEQVAPAILHNSGLDRPESPKETFLLINNRLRHENNQRIESVCAESAPAVLWRQPFQQLTNSKVESAFADERSYFFKNQKIDQQTHLGFDLASTAHSVVEASNDGVVLFAGYLGIYGNTVLLDHGLGLVSLYGHLSALETSQGDSVVKGQSLGRTGQTGLAAGDHLHFSMIVQGVQVSPLEWWDETWLRNHIYQRLRPGGETE